MKRSLAMLCLALALAASPGIALEPKAPPSPIDDAAPRTGKIRKGVDGSSIFIGRYGELVEFPYGWTAVAEMRESAELVYVHRKSHDDFGRKPFNPTPADFKPENFSPMGLFELVVVPKNAPGGLPSLEAMIQLKEKELKARGVEYRVARESNDSHWPVGTVHVETLKPYRLVQTYAESPREFYILTAGARLQEGEFGLGNDRVLDFEYAGSLLRRSLGTHLLSVDRASTQGTPFNGKSAGAGDLWSEMKAPRVWAMMAIFGAAMLIFAILPGDSSLTGRARLFGRSLLIFPLASGLMGFLGVYLPARLGGFVWRHSEDATIIPMLMIPCLSWLGARRFGSAHSRRVAVLTGSVAALWITAMTLGPRSKFPQSAGELLFWNTLIFHAVGVLFALIFALAFGPVSRVEEVR